MDLGHFQNKRLIYCWGFCASCNGSNPLTEEDELTRRLRIALRCTRWFHSSHNFNNYAGTNSVDISVILLLPLIGALCIPMLFRFASNNRHLFTTISPQVTERFPYTFYIQHYICHIRRMQKRQWRKTSKLKYNYRAVRCKCEVTF